MDFKLVLSKLLAAFEKESIRYALVWGGGVGHKTPFINAINNIKEVLKWRLVKNKLNG